MPLVKRKKEAAKLAQLKEDAVADLRAARGEDNTASVKADDAPVGYPGLPEALKYPAEYRYDEDCPWPLYEARRQALDRVEKLEWEIGQANAAMENPRITFGEVVRLRRRIERRDAEIDQLNLTLNPSDPETGKAMLIPCSVWECPELHPRATGEKPM